MGGISGFGNVHALQWITDTWGENVEYDVSQYTDEDKAEFMEFGGFREVAPGVVRR